MTVLKIAATLIILLLLASSPFAGPDRSIWGLGLALSPADDLFSAADLSTLLDPNGTQHYGPYSSSSPDSGTCGPDWATDTFDRHFTVMLNQGTYTVVEQFKNGSFVTISGPSPGTCDNTDGSPAGTVDGGKTGSMQGYFI